MQGWLQPSMTSKHKCGVTDMISGDEFLRALLPYPRSA